MSNYVPSPYMPEGCVWSNFEHATLKYCEDNLCGWIAQPANTWSNLIYVIVGLYVLRKNKYAELSLFGPIAIAVGLSSFFYHMSFTNLGQIFDLSSMYLFGGLLLTMNLMRLNYVSNERHRLVYALIIAVCVGALLLIQGKSGPVIFGVLVVSSLFFEHKIYKKNKGTIVYKNLVIALSIFATSFLSWIVDSAKIACDPSNHFIQGHALWHTLNAFCFLYLHKFYSQFYKPRNL